MIKLSELQAVVATMDIEPESKRPIDVPFMPDDVGSYWWYVTDSTGEKLIACQNEEHAKFVADAIAAMPALVDIAKAALAYTRPVETEQDARDKETARRALLAALAKVSL